MWKGKRIRPTNRLKKKQMLPPRTRRSPSSAAATCQFASRGGRSAPPSAAVLFPRLPPLPPWTIIPCRPPSRLLCLNLATACQLGRGNWRTWMLPMVELMAVASSPSTKGANSFFVERLPHPPLLIRSSIGAGSNSGSGAARRRLPHSPLIIIVPALPAARRGSHGRARQPRYRIRRPWSTSAPNSTGRYYFTLGPPPKKKIQWIELLWGNDLSAVVNLLIFVPCFLSLSLKLAYSQIWLLKIGINRKN